MDHSVGHLKFWKKKPVGIEFAKHFRSHLGPIEGLAVGLSAFQGLTLQIDLVLVNPFFSDSMV